MQQPLLSGPDSVEEVQFVSPSSAVFNPLAEEEGCGGSAPPLAERSWWGAILAAPLHWAPRPCDALQPRPLLLSTHTPQCRSMHEALPLSAAYSHN